MYVVYNNNNNNNNNNKLKKGATPSYNLISFHLFLLLTRFLPSKEDKKRE